MTVTGQEIYGQCAPGSEAIVRSPNSTNRSATTESIAEPIRMRPTGDSELIRIASVPAEHVYVRHLDLVGDGASVVRLMDPAPLDDTTVAGQWWPPTMLTPRWVQMHHQDFDVFHIQFGFDAQEPAHLASVVEELKRHGKPLVYTVHDLRNPHHADRQAHDAHLDILIPQADKLITLTSGAADAVEQRWGRRPQVIVHPHVVEIDRMRAPNKRADDRFVVGIHAKSVRASMNPLAVIEALMPLTAQLSNLHLQVNIHHDVFDSAGPRHDHSLVKFLSAAAADSVIDLNVHHCFTDDELWEYLQSLDVSVLPYRFGTHSGWLEACYDLGTTVVAPTCGYFSEQRPCLSYVHDEDRFDGVSLRSAVTRAYHERPFWRADPAQRAAERTEIAMAHLDLYESLLR
ncbi:MAG: glycosyltransferase family 1 protein [Antricoccus sp.]